MPQLHQSYQRICNGMPPAHPREVAYTTSWKMTRARIVLAARAGAKTGAKNHHKAGSATQVETANVRRM